MLYSYKQKESNVKHEMKWISIWILSNTVLALLCLIYFYLNNELSLYGIDIMTISILSTTVPYSIWKYNQMKFVEKQTIIIQILKD